MKITGFKILFLFLAGSLIFIFIQRYKALRGNLQGYQLDFHTQIVNRQSQFNTLEKTAEFRAVLDEVKYDQVFANAGNAETTLLNTLTNSGMILLVYKDDQLKFWSTNQVLPDIHQLTLGTSSLELKNGQYLVFKRINDQITWVFMQEIRSVYELQNNYLINKFTRWFNIPEFIRVLLKPVSNSLPVFSADNKYLFSIILDQRAYAKTTDFLATGAWVFLLVVFYLFLYQVTKSLERRRFLQFILAVILPLTLRYLMVRYQFPDTFYALQLFSPTIYSSSTLFYSLGDFFLNMILFLWLTTYLFEFSNLETSIRFSRKGAISVSFVCIILLTGVLYFFNSLFRGLVQNSNIPMDLVNILDLNYYSLLALLLIGLLWLTFYLLVRFSGRLLIKSGLPDRTLKLFLVISVLLVTVISLILKSDLFYPLLIGIMIIAVYSQEKQEIRSFWSLGTSVFILTISLVTALKLISFTKNKDDVNRISFAEKLQKSSDPVSEFLLKDNEEKISQDSILGSLVLSRQQPGRTRLFRVANQHLQKDYFGRSFAGFELKTFLYDKRDQLISGQNVYSLKVFKSAANSPKVRKVSTYFYQLQGSLPSYFGIIPIIKSGQPAGSLVVWIVAKYIGENNAFPDLLIDGKIYFERRQEKYSYAYYENGSLLDKFGKYPYGISNREFVFSSSMPEISYYRLGGYNHLIYHPEPESFIIVSKPVTTFFKQVAVFSYILAFFLLSFVLLLSFLFAVKISKRSASLSSLLNYLLRQRILYKSRIQLSVISGVLASLFIIGWVTLYYIQNQYKTEQRELLGSKIDNLRKAFESEMPTDTLSRQSENSNLIFLSLATEQNADLNFFDTNGDLVFTSLSKLYDRGLVSSKMDPQAYTQMFVSGRTELVNNERIGELNYLSVYAPVRNAANQVVGYINFPYFANQNEIGQKLSGFVSSLINVYVFVFLLIGLFAFVLANSITYPLALIQENLRRIKIGNINEPLIWKRDDEIGDLIKEYNSMVKALEASAEKLARSEKESAWREMAKQVAHEIKNPLTPLKLGIQHLERGWKNKDPRFDENFKKFSATFIQQIDSLSAIATEFSNFAQMPPAFEQIFDLQELTEHALTLFNDHGFMEIGLTCVNGPGYQIKADKDQLQRALNNIIKNALQAMPEGHKGIIILTLDKTQETVSLSIQDNGQGMSAEIRDKIFMPNFTTKSSGMGLGLAFVKKAIENARGTVNFESVESEGTCFMIGLPLYRG